MKDYPVPPLGPKPDVLHPLCPSRQVLQHLTSRWGALILVALQGRTLRFSQLRRALGDVSERMLAQTLQGLEADGMVLRVAHDVVPPHVDYSLTEIGAEAAVLVNGLAKWVERRLPDILGNRKDA
ncbi:winged helix-turn-helix transcriptional regulator [Paragemmobacter straminiformis]|uniref:Helix-turn-helix transcriptional regulator n=1 Tax=Paragemmobacter straminiformis TaxID=2045119 RepID=A0A842I8V7_9RHOB|nr:helix-turn-helix domain-containing protein [Gemmobacter straminiformis]MBC2835504.1 helix-turn-helix transcriptional regulator [Gemmobacter straminiformis]